MLDRDVDMAINGTRHPAFFKWKVGFGKDGEIISLDVDVYLNAGCSEDLSVPYLIKTLLCIDNAYK